MTAVSLRSDISIAANLASLIDQRCTWRQAGQRNWSPLRGMPAKVRMSTTWPVSTSTLLAGHLMTTLKSICGSLGTCTQCHGTEWQVFRIATPCTLAAFHHFWVVTRGGGKFSKHALRRNNTAAMQMNAAEHSRRPSWSRSLVRASALDRATPRHRIRYRMR